MDCKQAVDELKSKVKAYEGMLEQVLDEEEKFICTITAGPLEENGKTFYRSKNQGQEILLTLPKGKSFFKGSSSPKIGDEVVVINSAILSVVPAALTTQPELPEFKLINWNEIGGLKSQLDEIRTAVELPLKNRKLYEEYGMTPLKGILLYGPPGCGKTLIGKAIASTILESSNHDASSFVYIKGAELLNPLIGVTEQKVAELFRNARRYYKKHGKRAVVFIDEAEAILPRRGSRISSDVESTIVPTFLSEMDGLEEGNPLMVLSTNLPNSLDEAIVREGRIDLKLEIKRPTIEDAIDIFEIHLGKAKCANNTTKELAKQAVELLFTTDAKMKVSGAMIETIVKRATQKTIVKSIEAKQKLSITFDEIKEVILTL